MQITNLRPQNVCLNVKSRNFPAIWYYVITVCVPANAVFVIAYNPCKYNETSLNRHSMGPENNFGLGGCWIMECLLPYLCMVTVHHNNGQIRENAGL